MNAELVRFMVDAAGRLAPVAAQLLLQSTLLLGAGLIGARLLRRHGPALESVVLRTTLVMALLTPFVSVLLTRLGVPGRQWELPARQAESSVAEWVSVSPAAKDSRLPLKSVEPMPETKASTQSNVPSASGTASGPAGLGAEPTMASSEKLSLRHDRPAQPATLYAWVAGLWAAVGAFLLLRLALAHHRITRLLRESDLAAVPVFESCTALARELMIPSPEVRVHTDIKSPLLIGWLRPAILLPDVKGLEEVVATREVLLHELAHRARHDCFWHLLSRAIAAIFWVQPLLWILARRIEETAEDVCDNYVIEHAGDRRAYAEQLVALAEQLQYSPTEALAGTGVIAFRSALGRRVVRILDGSRNLSVGAGRRAGTCVSTAIAGLAALISLVGVKAAATQPVVGGQKITIVAAGAQAYARGVLAPDESAVAYSEDSAKGSDIMVRDLASGRAWKVTDGAGEKSHDIDTFVWSPDSKSVAYWWWEDGAGMSLRIGSRDGGPPRAIALAWDKSQPDAPQANPSFRPEDWSRDGRRLVGAWTLANKSRVLATVELANGEVHVLGDITPQAGHPRFSPDGKFVVYDREMGGNRDIYLMSVDGARTTRLTDSPADDSTPIFSADGRYVLFSSNQRGSSDLWAIAFADGGPVGSRFLSKVDFGNPTKRISAAGKLAFASGGRATEIFEVNAAAPDKSLTAIARSSFGRNVHPSWSPDGRKVAYARQMGWDGSRPWQLCVQSTVDGREEVYETGMRIFDWMFWAPDGQSLAVGGPHQSGPTGMYLYSLVTRERVTKPFSSDAVIPLGFMPDGKSFRLLKQQDGRAEIMVVDLKTNTERVVTTPAERAMLASIPLVRPNLSGRGTAVASRTGGAPLAYSKKAGDEIQLMVRESIDREPRVIARAKLPLAIRSASWSPDGTQVAYFVSGTDENKQQLRVAAADGASDRLLHEGNFWHTKIGPRWSQDGTRIAVTLAQETVSEIGVLENFLPVEKLAQR